jgi:hypothetical protein
MRKVNPRNRPKIDLQITAFLLDIDLYLAAIVLLQLKQEYDEKAPVLMRTRRAQSRRGRTGAAQRANGLTR